MTKDELLNNARRLPQVSADSIEEYSTKSEKMVMILNEKILSRPNVHELIGDNNIEMMKDNHANHARFMTSVFTNFNPDALVETVLWVFRAYRSHGFTTNYWSSQLNAWMEVIREELNKQSLDEIEPYYHWLLINIPSFVNLSDKKLSNNDSKH
ncbi:MAG: hypothetical protein MI922_16230 [Bacteroidales bacterium]|nr:hypothetical protein [Bacteroidales bacterium]